MSENKTPSAIWICLIAIVLVVAVTVGVRKCGDSAESTETLDRAMEAAVASRNYSAEAQAAARQLVENALLAPASADFVSERVVKHEGLHYIFHVKVDSQNAFGAMVRTSFCVYLEVDADRETYFTSTKNSVQVCSDPPTADEILAMAALNGWPTARSEP